MRRYPGWGGGFLLGMLVVSAAAAAPLHEAARTDNVAVLARLQKQGADPNQPDDEGNTALHHAVAEGKVEAVVALLKWPGINVNARNPRGETPLHLAGTRGRPFIATRLIEQGADINVQDQSHRTPLCNAALAGHPEILQVLLNRGADINGVRSEASKNIPGRESIPLECALRGNQRVVADLLIDKGADLGSAVMAAAIATRDRDLIGRLLARGGRIDYRMLAEGEQGRGLPDAELLKFILDRDSAGRQHATPLLFDAVRSGHRDHVAVLLALGINVNGRDTDGNTPLHHAAVRSQNPLFRLLLAHGADVNARNRRGETPLHKLLGAGFPVDGVKVLVEGGASLKVRDEAGETPLHLAAAIGATDVVGYMLAKGADKNIKNARGLTPGEVALNEMGHVDVARMLGVTVPAPASIVTASMLRPLPPVTPRAKGAGPAVVIHPGPLFVTHPREVWRSDDSHSSAVKLGNSQLQVKNGGSIPLQVEFMPPLRDGDLFTLFGEGQRILVTLRPTVNAGVTRFATDLRITVREGFLRALVTRKNGQRELAVATVKVREPAVIPARAGGSGEIQVWTRPLGGSQADTEVLVVHNNNMAQTAHVEQVLVQMQSGAVEIGMTPWLAKDPLLSIHVRSTPDVVRVLSYTRQR